MNSEEKTEKEIKEDRLLSALGLCVRAGGIIFGVPMICEAMQSGGKNMPLLVIEAGDTSENTHKRISDRCGYYKVKHIRTDTGCERLAAALGKHTPIAAVAVKDKRFIGLIEKYI